MTIERKDKGLSTHSHSSKQFLLARSMLQIHHLVRGEFIPWWVLYPPVVLYWVYLSIRHWSWTLFTAANPGIYTGGAYGESKYQLCQALYRTSPKFAARTGLIEDLSLDERLKSLQSQLLDLCLEFPIVLKPDVGQGGLAVEVIWSLEQARSYLRRMASKTLVVQEFVPGSREVGIYYFRLPNQERGQILDITEKHFPSVKGDGKHSVEALVLQDPRARLFAKQYLEQLGSRAQSILPLGEELCICRRGNWVQGCIFLNGARLWSTALERRIDEISRGVPGFFIGRYDVRYDEEDDLMAGRAFKIVELNGVSAIPTSMKDPHTSVWQAWGLFCQVMGLLYTIGAQNRTLGYNPMLLIEFLEAYFNAKNQMKTP
ncbi:hypothetical protein BX600DRAFT_514120 [Xylariales sp. PMI_506]|nr:hypothetical protein BX600DRAFT_514120 [Xylariales sp. PMI_506]